MSEQYNEGDLIRATKGQTEMSGAVRTAARNQPEIGDTHWTIEALRREGWTIEVTERAKPQRKVGWYRDAEADLWYWDGEQWRYDGAEGADTWTGYLPEPYERMYTRDEVVNLVKSSAYLLDPTWMVGGSVKKLIDNLEASL